MDEKKCFLCEKVAVPNSPLCAECEVLYARMDLEYQTKMNNLIKQGIVGEAAMARESGIPLHAVKWYMYRRQPAPVHADISFSDKMYGDHIWAMAEGRVDSPNSLILQQYLNQLMEMGFKHIILDLSHVRFFSSNGIRVVLAAYKSLHPDGSFRIANPSPSVTNVLGLVNMDRLLLEGH